MMCPRVPWLTVRGAPWSPRTPLFTRGHDPFIRARCLKARAVPCSASLVPSTAGPRLLTGGWRFSQLLFSPALTGRKFELKIRLSGIQIKVRIFFPVGLSLRTMISPFISRQDLLLTWPSLGNCYVPEWVGLAELTQTSQHFQLLMSLISKSDLNGESVAIELSEINCLNHARNYFKENRRCCFFPPELFGVTGKEILNYIL